MHARTIEYESRLWPFIGVNCDQNIREAVRRHVPKLNSTWHVCGIWIVNTLNTLLISVNLGPYDSVSGYQAIGI